MFKHLLPTSRAWSLTANKNLRRFFEALVGETIDEPKKFLGSAALDVFPQYTRDLNAWEAQFELSPVRALTDAQRRQRLAATWSDSGGQSPAYLQGLLRTNGFDVYLHDWWVPGTEPSVGVEGVAEVRNPLTVINSTYVTTVSGVDCGEELAACGEAFAECGNFTDADGYPLVNKFVYDSADVGYTVPNDPQYWPFFMYVGGPNFGDVATVPVTRRYEFEALLLKIRPAHLWIGVIVRYV